MFCTLKALAGLSWADAKQIAAAVSFDLCTRRRRGVRPRSRPQYACRRRQHAVGDRVGAARALNIAATLLGLRRRSTWASVHVTTNATI